MIMSEYRETTKAIQESDEVEIIDWLIDVYFVAVGTYFKLWWNIELLEKKLSTFSDKNATMRKVNWKIIDFKINMNIWKKGEAIENIVDVCLYCLELLMNIIKNKEWVEECINEVCRSNNSKLPFEKDENGKVRKGKNFKKPRLLLILQKYIFNEYWNEKHKFIYN